MNILLDHNPRPLSAHNGYQQYAVYIGPRKELQGKRTILFVNHYLDDECECQFDDRTTGYGYGWTLFPRKHFRVVLENKRRQIKRPK